MKYKELLMLSLLWSISMSTLGARDLLACEFNPSERSATGILGSRQISIPAMYRRFTEARNYETMHPVFRR